MKFALVNNKRCIPTPKTKGICPVCNGVVFAKCGQVKEHHWAHETKQNCHNDRWETEGDWHRNWKNKFPPESQEKILIINGEKNIADVQTDKGLVLEFQHSHITPEEQQARENAYKDMIWVVDGTRLKYDFPRFKKRIKDNLRLFLEISPNVKLFSIDFYDEVLPKSWINSSVPVVLDFLGIEKEENADVFQKYLYFLLPRAKVQPNDFSMFLLYLPRKEFLPLINNDWALFYPQLLSSITKIQKTQKGNSSSQPIIYSYRYNPWRYRIKRRFW